MRLLAIRQVLNFVAAPSTSRALSQAFRPLSSDPKTSKMAEVRFAAGLVASDPEERPVVFVGQLAHLQQLSTSKALTKLGQRVSEEVWSKALKELGPNSSVSLYLNAATVVALPNKCSRHNAPSRAHSLTKLVKATASGKSETVVVVCQRSDAFASGCAVARAYSRYSRKTSKAASDNSDSVQDEEANGSEKTLVDVEFVLVDDEDGLSSDDVATLQHASHGIQYLTARITDTPCNEMHTEQFLEEILNVSKELGVKCHVVSGEALAEQGFGGIYGVGKAALHPPALAVLSHLPEGATQTVAWVGKGIVYDTGGLSIKSKTGMPGMKRDCGGAAACLGAFYAAVKSGFKENLHAVFCLAENAVGERATRPDDIHMLYSGKTVEINNTDAEGRLVLGDGVAYARKDLKADVILDIATLTGAQGIATGKYHAAHLTNDEEWEKRCFDAGKTSGDLSFPIVFTPELHFPEFSSAVADMKNSVGDRGNAQTSCAGLFIYSHLGFDFPGVWIHVDIASPAHVGERATGYGVALLNVLFGKYSESKLLQEAAPRID